jgi:hypothetical protein
MGRSPMGEERCGEKTGTRDEEPARMEVVVGGRWWWGGVEKEAPRGRTNFANTWGMRH